MVGIYKVTVLALVLAVLSTSSIAHAQGLSDGSPGSQQSERHNPSSPGFTDFSRGYSQDQLLRSQRSIAHVDPLIVGERFPRTVRRTIVIAPWYLGLSYPGYVPFGYGPYYNSPYPYPLVAPYPSIDPLFAPQAQPQFQAPDAPAPRQAQAPIGPQQQPQQQPGNFQNQAPPGVTASDSRARAHAWKLIDSGDAEFKQKHFPQALTRYRDAQAAARDLAEGYFREGHALVAIARYSDAFKAYRRGLAIDADWADSDFRLDQIYGENKLTKSAHVDALVAAVAQHPHDLELLFLAGVYLYFDGQTARSAQFFHRAAQVLGPADTDLLTGFLKHVPAEPKAAPKLPPAPAPAGVDQELPPGIDT